MMRSLAVILVFSLFSSCRPDTYIPKPRGYYHIDLPQHSYKQFNDPSFPYSFEMPTYGNITSENNIKTINKTQDNEAEKKYWINIDFPSLGGRIYLSYKLISPSQPLSKLLDDAYQMTQYHTKKADKIDDFLFNNDTAHVYGTFYDVAGNAASAYQFYATDSVKHWLRGSLYFEVSPNADSLKPVNDFLRKDMEHMLKTLRWH